MMDCEKDGKGGHELMKHAGSLNAGLKTKTCQTARRPFSQHLSLIKDQKRCLEAPQNERDSSLKSNKYIPMHFYL